MEDPNAYVMVALGYDDDPLQYPVLAWIPQPDGSVCALLDRNAPLRNGPALFELVPVLALHLPGTYDEWFAPAVDRAEARSLQRQEHGIWGFVPRRKVPERGWPEWLEWIRRLRREAKLGRTNGKAEQEAKV